MKKKTYLEKVSTFVFINSIIYNTVCLLIEEHMIYFMNFDNISKTLIRRNNSSQKNVTKLQFKNNFLI